MSKAVKISGGFWIVITIIMAIIFFALGGAMLGNVDHIAAEAASQTPELTLEQVKAVTILTGAVLAGLGGYFLVGMAFTIVLMVLVTKKLPKVASIIIGVFAILLGSELPGIFFLIHAIKEL